MRALAGVLSLSLWGCAALEAATAPTPLPATEMAWHDELVSLAVSVEGHGVVSMQQQLRQCGKATCLYEVDPGALVVLEASAEANMRFVGWDGSCSGSAPVCRFQAQRGELVVARFEPIVDTSERGARRDATAIAQVSPLK